MKTALNLAARGRGFVEPNPMVGCILVKNNRVVGRGFHRRFGGPHAEAAALRAAGQRARGATAYVTLEPCSHAGKTPPCADALIRAKVRRVIVAMRDPNPLVAGRGIRRLRAAGIRCDIGLLRREALALNAPFVKYHRAGRPYVILKWAQSIDGKIATRTGDSKWITSRDSRAAAHALRARVDAVMVGVNTVLVDDPQLTARLAEPRRVATRIVIDPHLRTPQGARLVRSARETPTIIVAASGKPKVESRKSKHRIVGVDRKRRAFERAGCQVIELALHRGGFDLGGLLDELRRREMTNILVEGGGCLLGAFVQKGLADEAWIFVAPRLIGGRGAVGPLEHAGPGKMHELPGVRLAGISHHGPDLCYNVLFV